MTEKRSEPGDGATARSANRSSGQRLPAVVAYASSPLSGARDSADGDADCSGYRAVDLGVVTQQRNGNAEGAHHEGDTHPGRTIEDHQLPGTQSMYGGEAQAWTNGKCMLRCQQSMSSRAARENSSCRGC